MLPGLLPVGINRVEVVNGPDPFGSEGCLGGRFNSASASLSPFSHSSCRNRRLRVLEAIEMASSRVGALVRSVEPRNRLEINGVCSPYFAAIPRNRAARPDTW